MRAAAQPSKAERAQDYMVQSGLYDSSMSVTYSPVASRRNSIVSETEALSSENCTSPLTLPFFVATPRARTRNESDYEQELQDALQVSSSRDESEHAEPPRLFQEGILGGIFVAPQNLFPSRVSGITTDAPAQGADEMQLDDRMVKHTLKQQQECLEESLEATKHPFAAQTFRPNKNDYSAYYWKVRHCIKTKFDQENASFELCDKLLEGFGQA